MGAPVIVVFSQMRWDFVVQRPQQLLSRLAGRWRVLYVEEPMDGKGGPWLEVRRRGPDLTVLVPRMALETPGFADEQLPSLQALLKAHLKAQQLHVDLAWLYTPMALPLAQALQPSCLVYDCIEELSARPRASAELLAREQALFEQAQLVLTAGPSLYEAKRKRHGHAPLYCLPSSVDADHYAAAQLRPDSAQAAQARQLQAALPRPRLGYFGVIDERLDFELLAELARQRPDWSLVMAGPVLGIDAAQLPRAPNLHWLGPQPYERLPYLVADWDLCILPFLQNGSTRYLNPTKTLEFMAADKPVVSTAIRDVLWLYGDAVTIAHSADAFEPACAAVLAESPAARSRRAIEMLSIVCMSSWDHSADSVHKLLSQALAAATPPLAAGPPPAAVADVPL